MQAGRPSETAARIALRRVAAARDPFYRRLLAHPDEPYSAWFAEAHSGGHAPLPDARASRLRALADVLDPGGFTALLTRKRFVEDEVRAALQAGAEQVVVLGAGYDPLPLLLTGEFPRVRFFELDHPATQAVKRRALESRGALPAELVLVPTDFAAEPLEAALRSAPRFAPGVPSAFVAEGVLMYLAPRDLDRLLRAVVELGGPAGRFVFSLVDRASVRDPGRGAGRAAAEAARVGEPVRSVHHRRSLPAFLARRGLRCRRICDAEDLWRLYLEPLGAMLRPRPGELLVVAEAASGAAPALSRARSSGARGRRSAPAAARRAPRAGSRRRTR